MKRNTLLIIFIALLIISLGGLTLFFGYKYFTVDNKCEEKLPTNECNKEVKNMTDSEILRYIGKQTYKYGGYSIATLEYCIIEGDVITLNGILSSTSQAQEFNYNLVNHVVNLAGNSFSIEYDKENYECKFNIIYEYAVVNGVVAVKVSQESDFSYPWKWYHFYDVKNDKILEMGDAMRLMGVTDLGGAKNYEDLNNDCSDLRITNHNKVTINKYVAECA